MMNMTVRWLDRYTEIDFPCGDDYLTERLRMLDAPGEIPHKGVVLCVNHPKALAVLDGQILDMDEVNFLANRLDTFDANELNQFYAAVQHEGVSSVKDMINLTYNLARYTVIRDMSSMTAVGRNHLMNIHGYLTSEQQQTIDFASIGRSLIRSNKGIVTEYGLLFKNESVPFRQEYDGENYPHRLYTGALLTARMQYQGRTEYLYMPCDEYSIHKAAMRLGAAVEDCEASFYDFATDDQQWYDRLKRILSEEGIVAVNWVTEVLNNCELDLDDLEYIMQYAGREDCGAIVALTTHMEDFIVVPGICEDNEVAEYFLDNVYGCDLPEEMEAYLDMCDFGAYLMKQRDGRFVEAGFVCMEPGCSLDQILGQEDQEEIQAIQM